MNTALLTINSPDGRSSSIELSKSELLIGRDATCDVPLEDSITSRRHARIYRDGAGQFWIQDLRSKNGTILNDQPLSAPARLKSGDRIAIGTFSLTLRSDQAPSSVVLLSDPQSATQATSSAWGASERLVLPQRRLEKLYELNARLTGRFDRNDLLKEVLEICVELLRFERAGIAVWKGKPHPPEWIELRGPRGSDGGELRISRSLVDKALHNAERILITDTASGAFDPTASIISNNIRSAMCVPMEFHTEVRGVIYGDRVSSTGSYTKEDIDFFAALGQLGAMGLANIQLLDEMKRRQKVEMELQLAREIQSHLFPPEPLDVSGVRIDALNDPGLMISGDYYDYFMRPDGLIAVIIADVAGKGAPASLLMANLQAAVHVTLMTETNLLQTVRALNALICRNVSHNRFITAIFGLLDPQTRILRFVNAGHLPPYLLSAGTVRAVEFDSCLPLGIEEDHAYRVDECVLDGAGETLLFYTDGITDAENDEGEMYTQDRLENWLRNNTEQSPPELVDRLRRAVKQFTRGTPQTDDITIMALRMA